MADRVEEVAAALNAYEAEREMSLRIAGKNDPLPGLPLRHQIGRDPNDVALIEAGKWEEEGWGDQLGMPPSCPVRALGRDGPVCWFLDTMGTVYALEARSSGKGPIDYLFGGRTRYLEWAWPRWSAPKKKIAKGEDGVRVETIVTPSRVIGWEADDARQCLVNACSYAGIYDYVDQVRGRGAWRGLNDKLIYHAGDCVLIDGKWLAPGEHEGFIYPVRPRIGRPALRASREGPGSPGDELFEVLRSFNWDRPELDPRLVLGWLMTAKIGGALRRRPVLFIHGGEGSGKSTLQDLLRATMNGALMATAETSQAGIYHHLNQDSIAILIDELEARDDARAIDKILALARIAYSGDKMHRGSKEGVGKEFMLMSSFMASAVTKPATEAADDSRMAVVMLRERAAVGAKLEVDPKWADALGRHLLRRCVDWWPHWDDLVAVFRKALVEVGHNDRSGDTFAPLAAGCHIALRDTMPEPGELVDWQRWLHPRDLSEIANRERTWARCLRQLLNAMPDAWRQYSDKSLMAVLNELRRDESFAHVADERLAQIGLALSYPERVPQTFEHARLFIPSNHPGVHALFEGTGWAGKPGAPGPWCNVLRQAPQELWRNGKCDKGLDKKASGIHLDVARAIEAC